MAMDLVVHVRWRMAVTLRGWASVPCCFTVYLHLWFIGATGPPAMPDVVAFRAVLNEQKESQRDGKRSVQTAEDHVEEMSL